MNNKRAFRNFTMHVRSTPDRVFPLLCPVREYDWIENWECEMVHSRSGFAELDCVFKTRHEDVEETWTVSRYEPNELIEFILASKFRVMRYRFTLAPDGENGTRIEIEQTATALNSEGNKHAEDPRFELHMKTLEIMLNHYLVTGKMISNDEALRQVDARAR